MMERLRQYPALTLGILLLLAVLVIALRSTGVPWWLSGFVGLPLGFVWGEIADWLDGPTSTKG
jgi:hypothetical protein